MKTRIALAFLAALVSTSVEAQRHTPNPQWSLRKLTMPRRVLRLDFAPPDYAMLDSGALGEGYGLRVSGVDIDGDPEADEVHAHAGFGLAYGINRFVEVGAKVLPLRFHRNADYLDLELYLRWSFVQTRVADVGVQFVMQLPTNHPRVFGSSIGIPVRIRMGTVARLDFGIELELIVHDADPSDDVDVNVDPNLDIPVALSFNITPRFYLGGSFGLFVYDFDRVAFNGGGHVGYSIGRDTPLLDLTGSFKVYGAPDGRFGAFPGDGRHWEVIGGVRVYFAL